MKIGIINSTNSNDRFLTNIDELISAGFKSIDFQGLTDPNSKLYSCSDDEFNYYFIEFKKYIDSKNVIINQLHSLWTWPMFSYDNENVLFTSTISYYIKSIKAANLLGCKYVVIHHRLPYEFDDIYNHQVSSRNINIRFLKTLLPYAEKYNVILCLENLPFELEYTQYLDTLNQIIEINSPYLGLCLDTGHFNIFNNGYSIHDAIIKAGKYLKALHIHDNYGKMDNHLFPYLGTINWIEFIDALNEINFDGVFSIETRSKKVNDISRIAEYKKLYNIAERIINKKVTKNILFLGNSYSEDTCTYLPHLLNDKHIECNIEALIYPGCSIDQHIDFLTTNNPCYIHRYFDKNINDWNPIKNINGRDIILSKNWDYIVIQQCSSASGMKNTYGRVDELINLLNLLCINNRPQYIWNMTWAWPKYNAFPHKKEFYDNKDNVMHEGIVNNVIKYIIPNKQISLIIPNGLAIWEAKNIFDEHKLFRDDVHLSFDIGRYIASLVAMKTIFDVDISTINYSPININENDKKNCIDIASRYGDKSIIK